ncbi:MAG: response regulator transcription factor, partial [Clostridia bacterium]|nr:response regulator transcription factor [Clostridia bacterium]
MKIALVEDNELHREQISQEIQAYFEELNEVCELRVFDNGSEMLDHYEAVGGYDLLLLDIQLPGMDGVSVARQIRQHDEKVLIVFITNMTSYAVQGYSVHALDYILKPINRISFRNTLDHAREMFRQRTEHFISVTTSEGLLKLDISQIYFIETEKHAVRLYYTKDSFHINDTLKSIED